jgi:hypothetical protein
MAMDPALGDAGRGEIRDWITKHGEDRRREINERLQADRMKRWLLLEVKHTAGRLCELVTYLRYSDLTTVAGFQEEACMVESWEQLCEAVRARVQDPKVKPPHGDLELHFLTDVPLFDLPFHKIPSSEGHPLGEQHVCIVHSLRRARLADDTEEVRRWRSWEHSLRDGVIAQVPLQQWPPSPPWPSGGLCYVDFQMVRQPPNEAVKKRITKLIQLGAPFVCWPHVEATAHDLSGMLSAMTRDANTIEGLPSMLLTRRLSECPVATDVSMLWDEQIFRPFSTTQGAVTWTDGGSFGATDLNTMR